MSSVDSITFAIYVQMALGDEYFEVVITKKSYSDGKATQLGLVTPGVRTIDLISCVTITAYSGAGRWGRIGNGGS